MAMQTKVAEDTRVHAAACRGDASCQCYSDDGKNPGFIVDASNDARCVDGNFSLIPSFRMVTAVRLTTGMHTTESWPINHAVIDEMNSHYFWRLCSKKVCGSVNRESCGGLHNPMICPREKCLLCGELGHWDIICPSGRSYTDDVAAGSNVASDVAAGSAGSDVASDVDDIYGTDSDVDANPGLG